MVTLLSENVVTCIDILKWNEDIHTAPPFHMEKTNNLVEDARSNGSKSKDGQREMNSKLEKRKRHRTCVISLQSHLPVGVGDMVYLSEKPLGLGCLAGRRNIGLATQTVGWADSTFERSWEQRGHTAARGHHHAWETTRPATRSKRVCK